MNLKEGFNERLLELEHLMDKQIALGKDIRVEVKTLTVNLIMLSKTAKNIKEKIVHDEIMQYYSDKYGSLLKSEG